MNLISYHLMAVLAFSAAFMDEQKPRKPYPVEKVVEGYELSTLCGLAISVAFHDALQEEGIKAYRNRMEEGFKLGTSCIETDKVFIVRFPNVPEPHFGGYMRYRLDKDSFEIIRKELTR